MLRFSHSSGKTPYLNHAFSQLAAPLKCTHMQNTELINQGNYLILYRYSYKFSVIIVNEFYVAIGLSIIVLMTIDFQQLLIKYMRHLKDAEDTLFIELIHTPFSPHVIFTAEELQELRRIESTM